MKRYNAGIYLRLSSENNEENNSIEAQREITRNYASKKGYSVIKEYIDNGYSGILDFRPALNEMILDIVRKKINMVIVKDISRLTRNKNKTGWYTEIFFPDNDIRFISVTELIDSGERYEIDDSIMLRGIVNQHYISDISRKIRANKTAMKEDGKFVENRPPYGYKKEKDNKYKIVIDKKVEANIRRIYDMYIEGKTSGQIAEYFNIKNIETPSKYMKLKNASNKWREEQINNILRNPFYIGNTIINKYKTDYIKKTCKENTKKETWIIKENTHKAIVEKDKYYKVQEIKQNKQAKTKVKHEFPLKGLVYCGNCKRKMQYKVYKSNDKQKFLYESSKFCCSLVYKKRCKNKNNIKEKELNDIVEKEIIKRLNEIEINQFKKNIIDYYEKKDKTMQEIKQYSKEVQKLERKKSILYEKKCNQCINIEEFKIEYLKAKEEINYYRKLINKLEMKNSLNEKKVDLLLKQLKEQACLNSNFVKEIINRIEIYSENKIEIIFNI